jgi:hypothetical protein
MVSGTRQAFTGFYEWRFDRHCATPISKASWRSARRTPKQRRVIEKQL